MSGDRAEIGYPRGAFRRFARSHMNKSTRAAVCSALFLFLGLQGTGCSSQPTVGLSKPDDKPGKFDSGLIDAAVTPTGPIIVPQDEPTTDDSCVDAGGCETEEYEWIDAGPACGDGGVDDGEGGADGNCLLGEGCNGVVSVCT